MMFISKPPDGLPDHDRELHPSWRRYTHKYGTKKRIVRDMWIFAGAMMIDAPLALVLGLALLSTVASFAILDETR